MFIERVKTFGWENAIRGMRYSFNSENASDSVYDGKDGIFIGDKDKTLMLNLISAGSAHRKFLRAIHIQMSVNMSMKWWKQFDTYKIGTTALSRSTMHTLMKEPLSRDNFEPFEHNKIIDDIVDLLNQLIAEYNILKLTPNVNKGEMERIMNAVFDILPMSFLQERIIDMNYEVALNILHQRQTHKLKEWHFFCNTLLSKVPYLKEFYESTKGVKNA
jgi:hypothetical protein